LISNWHISSIFPTRDGLQMVVDLAEAHLDAWLVELDSLEAKIRALESGSS
jgi:hypothetical protein